MLVTVFVINASGLQKPPLAQKLPAQLMGKQPVAYWGFDRKGASLRHNRIQNPQTILIQGARYTAQGLDFGALKFNGRTGQIKIPIALTNELTLSAWFLPTSVPKAGSFQALALQSNQHTLTISLTEQGAIQIQQATPFSQGSFSLHAGRAIPANQWHHLAMVALPQQLTLFLNGQSVGHFNMSVPLSHANLLIAGQAYKGAVDELALFGQALTLQDIQALFALHKPAITPGARQMPQSNTWEGKAATAYAALSQAVNSGNWAAAATQAGALSDLVTTYLKDRKTGPDQSTQAAIHADLTRALDLMGTFGEAVEQAKYHEASDLFDQLDEAWETLEDQLNLPVAHDDSLTPAPWNNGSGIQGNRFGQTWSSSFGAGFSGGMSMGGAGAGNSFSGGGFSMRSSVGPNGQVQFESSGMPAGGLSSRSGMQKRQPSLWMHTQRIQLPLMGLKMGLESAQWKMSEVHATQLQERLTEMVPLDTQSATPQRRMNRRSTRLSQLPPAQKAAVKAQVQEALKHMTRLHAAVKNRDQEAAIKHLKAVETCIQAITKIPDNVSPLGQPQN